MPVDTDRSAPCSDRRLVLGGLLAAGFALATRPLAASTINTSNAGLLNGPVEIPVSDGRLPAFRALPDNAQGPMPIILVIQEIFGVHEHIRDICRRLAHAGYMAVAPELFYRQGDPSTISDVRQIIQDIVSRVPDRQVVADLDATLAWAADHGGDATRAGVIGFCWGGRMAWLYAAQRPTLRAAAAWYGRLEGATNDLTPRFPLDYAPSLRVPVLGLYGGKDTGIPLDSVKRMQDALATAGSASRIEIFADAGHAFNADYRPSYHEPSARRAWQLQMDWLHANGL